MKIIVGLGNPGPKYHATPHNIGFEIADLLAKRWGADFTLSRRGLAQVLETGVDGESVLLAKPTTFMNRSGETLGRLLRNRPVEPAGLLVLVDDVNLEIGRLRIRSQGSHGGHNGLRSIIESLGTEEFSRLRIGIRPRRPLDDLSDYVLSSLPPKDRDRLASMIRIAADAAEFWLRGGTEETANRFNAYQESEPS